MVLTIRILDLAPILYIFCFSSIEKLINTELEIRTCMLGTRTTELYMKYKSRARNKIRFVKTRACKLIVLFNIFNNSLNNLRVFSERAR